MKRGVQHINVCSWCTRREGKSRVEGEGWIESLKVKEGTKGRGRDGERRKGREEKRLQEGETKKEVGKGREKSAREREERAEQERERGGGEGRKGRDYLEHIEVVQGRGAEEVALVCQGSGQEGVEGGLDVRDGSQLTRPLATALQLQHNCIYMRDEKEGRKKKARSNKQQGKATQHTQSSHFS